MDAVLVERAAPQFDDLARLPYARMVADPLSVRDCCLVTDGAAAIVMTRAGRARDLAARPVYLLGGAAATGHRDIAQMSDLTVTAAVESGARAFTQARVRPADIDVLQLYDAFTINVLLFLEDLGFCKKGDGGKFVSDGNLISGVGKLPFNTDGGGLCSNHPVNRGGMTKILEAVRQLRGEAHPKVQVPNCDLAIAHGTGGLLGVRHAASTCILERV